MRPEGLGSTLQTPQGRNALEEAYFYEQDQAKIAALKEKRKLQGGQEQTKTQVQETLES